MEDVVFPYYKISVKMVVSVERFYAIYPMNYLKTAIR